MKEQNYVSAVIYIGSREKAANVPDIDRELREMFSHYEIICCFDGPSGGAAGDLGDALGEIACPALTVLYMGRRQGLEASMNAGVDASIGDYVFEIDDPDSFDAAFIAKSYQRCMDGVDIVMGETPGRSARGRLFYPLFNRFSSSSYRLSTSSCSLSSRRAINRVRAISDYAPYRKAAYAASGLAVEGIRVGCASPDFRGAGLGLAMDSLALYTDAFYKISFSFTALMVLVSVFELIYVVAVYVSGIPIGGWTTTMLAITFGFMGVFVSLTFLMKYGALVLRLQTQKRGYLIEKIEKTGR